MISAHNEKELKKIALRVAQKENGSIVNVSGGKSPPPKQTKRKQREKQNVQRSNVRRSLLL
jgi:hypothetical protein